MITQEQLENIINTITEITRYKWNGHAYDCTCPLAQWRHEKGFDRHPSAFITNKKLNEREVGTSWFFYCNSCGFGANLFSLIAELNVKQKGKYNAIEKFIALNEDDDIDEKMDRVILNTLQAQEPVVDNNEEVVFSEDELKPYVGKVPLYAIKRVTLDSCRKWELGHDVPRQRLVFPLRRWPDKGLVGMLGRTILSKEERGNIEKTTNCVVPKYYNYWSFERSLYMYGEYKVDPSYGKIILVEGPIDVISGYEAGYKNVVGVLGCRLTALQAEKLCQWDLPVIVMPDPDKKLLKSAKRELSNKLLIKEAVLPKGRDPGDLSRDEFIVAVENSSISF